LPLASTATPGYSTGPVPEDNEPSGCQAAPAMAGSAETKTTANTKIGMKHRLYARMLLPPCLDRPMAHLTPAALPLPGRT